MIIYSSLTRKREKFEPLLENQLKMYACGVTPYDEIHIGHARQAIVYDVIRTYYEYLGYKVNYIRNWTDVDDKIIAKARLEGRESSEISERYIRENSQDLETLKVKKANYEPKVTECIQDIIKYIQVLIEKGFAYVQNGEVLFSVEKFPKYGQLSNRKKDELINSEDSPNKQSQNDFVLWKPYKEGEPYWESPWSKGRPGWHIECSVMANKYLGDEIDIHGGGIDLIFPHHENEIAQSEAYTGKQFAKYWVHNGMVVLNGSKMSKSTGNFMTVKDALKDYFPEEIRYAVLTHQYGSDINFSKDLFLNARKRMVYFYTTILKMRELINSVDTEKVNQTPKIANLEEKFKEYMNDNFNTPKVVAEITDIFRELNKIIHSDKQSPEEKRGIFNSFFLSLKSITDILRIFEEDPSEYLAKLKGKILQARNLTEDSINSKLEDYRSAKSVKDYQKTDDIKNELKLQGIAVQESNSGVTWEIIF